MSLTSYRAAPPRGKDKGTKGVAGAKAGEGGEFGIRLGWPGSDLLSRVLRRSTIGAEGFNGRVRDGIGFGSLAMTTRPAKPDGMRKLECLRAVGRGGLSLRAGASAIKLDRAISTGRLRALPHVHLRPIDVVVFHGS